MPTENTTSDPDTDAEADASGGPGADGDPDTYFYATADGRWREKRIHQDRECWLLVRAPGDTRPIDAGIVDAEEFDHEWCPRCAPRRGSEYPLPDPDVVELIEERGGGYQLRLPSDVHVHFEHVQEHDAGFLELVADGDVVATLGDMDGWPSSVREALASIDEPPTRKLPRSCGRR